MRRQLFSYAQDERGRHVMRCNICEKLIADLAAPLSAHAKMHVRKGEAVAERDQWRSTRYVVAEKPAATTPPLDLMAALKSSLADAKATP